MKNVMKPFVFDESKEGKKYDDLMKPYIFEEKDRKVEQNVVRTVAVELSETKKEDEKKPDKQNVIKADSKKKKDRASKK